MYETIMTNYIEVCYALYPLKENKNISFIRVQTLYPLKRKLANAVNLTYFSCGNFQYWVLGCYLSWGVQNYESFKDTF